MESFTGISNRVIFYMIEKLKGKTYYGLTYSYEPVTFCFCRYLLVDFGLAQKVKVPENTLKRKRDSESDVSKYFFPLILFCFNIST